MPVVSGGDEDEVGCGGLRGGEDDGLVGREEAGGGALDGIDAGRQVGEAVGGIGA